MVSVVSHWDVHFSSPVQYWELESLVNFVDLIYSKSVRGEGIDKLCCSPAMSWSFKVQEYYHSLSSSNGTSFPWKSDWCSKVPSRVAFSWIAALGKILSTDNLRKRGVIV